MDVRVRVGLNLRKARRRRGVSQEELAHLAKVHQTYLSGVELGKRNPSIIVLDCALNEPAPSVQEERG